MAERVIKYQTQDGEQLLDPQIQGTDSQSSDQIRDTVKALRNGGASGAEAIDAARKTKISEEDVPPVEGEKDTKQADAVNVAKDIAKTLRDALKEHGDEMQGVFIKNMNTSGVTIKVTYKPDEQGEQTEDEFNFRWNNGVVSLDNGGESVDLGQIQNRSGRSFIQKDILKDKLFAFIDSHDGDKTPSDSGQIPDGTPVNEENLWESDECQEAFCNAVTNFRNNAKDKEAIKALLKAARPYQKGNTIQEKLKGAVDWYNWFTENPPKNTKKQVFLEDEREPKRKFWNIFDKIIQCKVELNNLRNSGDFDWMYEPEFDEITQSILELAYKMRQFYDRIVDPAEISEEEQKILDSESKSYREYEEGLDEFMSLEDPVARGESDRPQGQDISPESKEKMKHFWDNDGPVVSEEDEFGPEVGDSVDYDGGHYKLYGYCGYEVVLQNVDDERDFKLVKPADIGIEGKKPMDETEYVDPEQLPDDEEDPTVDPAYIR